MADKMPWEMFDAPAASPTAAAPAVEAAPSKPWEAFAPQPAKERTWTDVPGRALESVGESIGSIPDVARAVIENPGEAAAQTAAGLMSMVNLPLQPFHHLINAGLQKVSPEAASVYQRLNIDPTTHLLQDYRDTYAGPGGVKEALAEHPLRVAGDVASIIPAVRGLAATAKSATAARVAANAIKAGVAPDVAAAIPKVEAAGVSTEHLTPAQLDRLHQTGNAKGYTKDVIGPEHNRMLFEEAGVTPTRSMITGEEAALQAEDSFRNGARGAPAAEWMKAQDLARQGQLETATNALRSDLTNIAAPLDPKSIGDVLSDRFNKAHTAEKNVVSAKYETAFDPDALKAANIPSHVPEATLRGLPDAIYQKTIGAKVPFAVTADVAPNSARAKAALEEYSRTGRLPKSLFGEEMPPSGADGTSWRSVDMMRRQLNGLRTSARGSSTDMSGMRRILDAFDEQFGKSNPLLNEARQAHMERVKLFDPGREGAAGTGTTMKVAGNTENVGDTLYNRLFGGSRVKSGEALADVNHLKRIFASDPDAMNVVREGALQRILVNNATGEMLSPRQQATAIKQALGGQSKYTYQALFSDEERARLQRHQTLLDNVASKSEKVNPSGTSYKVEADKRRAAAHESGIKDVQAMLDTAGSVVGSTAGLAFGPAAGFAGVPAGGIAAHYATPMLSRYLGPKLAERRLRTRLDPEALASAKAHAPYRRGGYFSGGR